ncbi:MAG: GatB/YqeY domain-containing protein [Candidatus Omnitrophota bacterium]|nr:GatB/YqeY domain-containing protein [Candidatus Omnitrophota bacterium]
MDLYEKIDSEMKDAMRGKDNVRLSVMRMLLAAVRNTEISKKVKKLEDVDIVSVIQRMIKEHKESIAQFEKGNRPDLVNKEKAELDILQKYVPAQMGEEELLSIIKATIQEMGITSKADTGKAMKAVMEKVKGKADGKVVNQLVMSLLK